MMYQAYEHKAISRSQTRKIIRESIEILNGIKKKKKKTTTNQIKIQEISEREREKRVKDSPVMGAAGVLPWYVFRCRFAVWLVIFLE